ncbi:MAG: hypothetical protein J6Y16_07570 [Treponema sp.]|nr:hypothetical protein [Treponema sp.]
MCLKKFVISIIGIFTLSLASLSALPSAFNKNLTDAERAKLERGEMVIKNLKAPKNMSIESPAPAVQKTLDTVKKLKPAYLAEVIQIYPYAGNEKLLETFEQSILDVSSYVGIPYYSERAEEWYDLYSSAKVKSKTKTSNGYEMVADLEMEPFGTINTSIHTERGPDYFYYESTNLNKLKYYDKYTCVKEKNMKSIVVITKQDGYWVLYGVGAVDAPSIFFLRERVETSFMNRIKTFCTYFFNKNKGKLK